MSAQQPSLKLSSTPSSTYASLIDQTTAIVPEFILESGEVLYDVPVAYKTWGKMNDDKDNVMVICHALTGSADVEDWWGPLLGPGKAFDPTRYFIFCANVIGSPYGTVSSVTINPETGMKWGPEMPGSCVKDDVRLHKIVLDSLGVKSVAVVIGGSMGGMTCLEYALNTPPGFVKHIVPIATSARHSAWCISWGEAQRQSIYSDPAYDDGYYCYDDLDDIPGANEDPEERRRRIEERQPTRGLAAARMAALLTYRSRDSFESRFGRKSGAPAKRGRGGALASSGRSRPSSPPLRSRAPGTPREDAWRAHNDGHRARVDSATSLNESSAITTPTSEVLPTQSTTVDILNPGKSDQSDATVTEKLPEAAFQAPLTNLELSMPGGSRSRTPQATDGKLGTGATKTPQVFSAQSYLRYQGDKFTSRFDANCYIHITRKMDTHDISFPTSIQSEPPTLSQDLPMPSDDASEAEQTAALVYALSLLPPALVIGIESDGLFTTREQREIAASIPDAELAIIPSPDGHDGFLLEFEAINKWVQDWLHRKLPGIYEGAPILAPSEGGFDIKKESLFGEAEADLTRW
ncbi:hypothetical protein QFC19_005380 [Naganishia cerealis]|uniref:Uncharacterized protein n=1 Tax=Naganishia cerealis TaxID=610337 RepID=A0ACC2VPE4_9TREE|nr:hypothetical protein QFC19_005380 [Naganishia cerealis]